MTAGTERTSVRSFGTRDLAAGARLVAQAGWNQVEDDWRVFVERGAVFAVEASDGAVVATAATLPYDGFAWISMVLVDVEWRRRGLATLLLDRCVAAIRAAGRTPMLDATPAGRAVYARLGFRGGFGLQRWFRAAASPTALAPAAGLPDSARAAAAAAIRDCTAGDLPALADLDAAAFGARRAWLIDALAARSRGFAAVAERGGQVVGFVLGRQGRTATQIGPVVAEDAAAGEALLRHAVARVPGPLLVDASDGHPALAALLVALGFAEQRPYTRMAWETDAVAGDPRRYLAAAGPELG